MNSSRLNAEMTMQCKYVVAYAAMGIWTRPVLLNPEVHSVRLNFHYVVERFLLNDTFCQNVLVRS